MTQTQDSIARTGYATLKKSGPKTHPPLSRLGGRCCKCQKPRNITQKVEQSGTKEAIFEHTISHLNQLE
jgi:hypothetical protein